MNFLINLVVVLVIGALIGYERQIAHGIVGIRSITLVMLGSFIFTYISTLVGGDPARIIAQVVTGTGFLSAGLIFKQDATCISNITTAVLIWCLSALGCLIGLGYLIESIVITITLILILKFYRKIFKNSDNNEIN